MALGTMNYNRRVVPNTVEILFNSEYTGRALTLDTTAFTEGVCKAGMSAWMKPMSSRCSDGYCEVSVFRQVQWQTLCAERAD